MQKSDVGDGASFDFAAVERALVEQQHSLDDLRADVSLLKSREWLGEVRAMMGTWALVVTGTFFLWLFFFVMMSLDNSLQLVGIVSLSVLWVGVVVVVLQSFRKSGG